MREWIDALPPAFTRGVSPVRTLVTGGVRIPSCRAFNRIIFLYLPSLFLVLFCERYVGDELPPVPVCATLTTPSHKCAGQGRVPYRHRSPLPKHLCKFQFIFLLRKTDTHISLFSLRTANQRVIFLPEITKDFLYSS